MLAFDDLPNEDGAETHPETWLHLWRWAWDQVPGFSDAGDCLPDLLFLVQHRNPPQLALMADVLLAFLAAVLRHPTGAAHRELLAKYQLALIVPGDSPAKDACWTALEQFLTEKRG